MFTAALATIAKKLKQAKCLWLDEHMDEVQFVYTMEYSSALKRKENPTYATTCCTVRTLC
jgi:hypothetical protein